MQRFFRPAAQTTANVGRFYFAEVVKPSAAATVVGVAATLMTEGIVSVVTSVQGTVSDLLNEHNAGIGVSQTPRR